MSQAVQVGMALGRPVKLMWPREEDFTHYRYRPMALIHATARAGQQRPRRRLVYVYLAVHPRAARLGAGAQG